LRSLRQVPGAENATLVVTVPNALSDKLRRGFQDGYEFINSDHRFWFTPYTLAKNMTLAGWSPQAFAFAYSHPGRLRRRLQRWLTRNSPWRRDGLIMTASVSNE